MSKEEVNNALHAIILERNDAQRKAERYAEVIRTLVEYTCPEDIDGDADLVEVLTEVGAEW